VELNPIVRALRDRWPVVLALAIFGLVTAGVFTTIASRGMETRYQATAPIQFSIPSGEAAEDTAQVLAEAETSAVLAASDLLSEDTDRFIFSDPDTAELLFVAADSDQAEAVADATALRQAFLDVDPLAGGAPVAGRLAEIEAEADRLSAELNALGVADQTVIDQHTLIDNQVFLLRDRLVELLTLDVTATDDDRATFALQRQQIENALVLLAEEKAALPPIVPDVPSVAFRQQALQNRLDELAGEYERLYLRQLGVTTGGSSGPVEVQDLTPPPPSLVFNGLLGLLVGTLLAVIAISIDTRTRRPAWVAADLTIPVLGEIPSRRLHVEPGKLWYDREARHPRKQAIQAMRAAVEGRLEGRPVSLAVAGIRTGSTGVQVLGLDLAASFANAGWSVLIVDAELEGGSRPNEIKGGGPTLAEVLDRRPDDSAGGRSAAIDALDKAFVPRRNLAVIGAGTGLESPADALSGTIFQVFLEEARARHDLVLVVGGDLRSPPSQVLFQRLDAGIISAVPGRTPTAVIEDLVEELTDRRVLLLGAAFLARKGSKVDRSRQKARKDRVKFVIADPEIPSELPPSTRPKEVIRAAAKSALAARVAGSPGPSGPGSEAGRPARAGAGSRNIRDELRIVPGHPAAESPRGSELLETLADAEDGSYEKVASFLMEWVTGMINASPGNSDFSEEVIGAARAGYMPLYDVKGLQSVGGLLTAEFRTQLGSRLGQRLGSEVARVLSDGVGGDDLSIDEWLAQEYFARHIQMTNQEPKIWHLSSRLGTIQVLVNSSRLTRERIDDLNTGLVRLTIDALEKNLKSAVRAGRAETVERLGEQLTDARTFEIALGWLYEGTTPNARIVYPSKQADQQPHGWDPIWTEGVKPNIAPLQRLGLLVLPVLTDEELQSLRPTG
jgi:Mrp family chromosome partitioning ATPase/xanthosine utilization system XapX-like protein